MHDRCPRPERHSLLGVEVDSLVSEDIHRIIGTAVTHGAHWIIGNHNLHSIALVQNDPKMREFFNRATYVFIDGMPIVYLGRLLGKKLTRANRITCLDWLIPVLQTCADMDLNVFFLGSMPGVADRAAAVLRAKVKGIKIATHHGYFNTHSHENQEVLQKIIEFRTHVLLVGMGMPRQEHWLLENFDKLNVNVAITLGAFMDYYAGVIPTPPRWMGRVGLEWLYRLCSEPKRLWRRYLLEPWTILPVLGNDIIRTSIQILHRRVRPS